ncbi:unnamed protein product, partial [Staurois parvus]
RVGSKRANRVPGASGRVVRNSRGQDRWSTFRVRIRIKAGSGRKQTGCRHRGSWERYTKALITGLVLLKYTSCNQPQVMA